MPFRFRPGIFALARRAAELVRPGDATSRASDAKPSARAGAARPGLRLRDLLAAWSANTNAGGLKLRPIEVVPCRRQAARRHRPPLVVDLAPHEWRRIG